MSTFAATASILSAQQLGLFVIEKYGLSKNSICSLLRTGMNHTYLLADNEAKSILRVYSHNWRSKAEVEEEIRLLTLLKDNGISISYPVADVDGNYIQEIDAPEGVRYAVVFSYAEGGKVRFIDPDACAKIGVIMAQMHNVTEHTALERIDYNDTTLLELRYRYAQHFFSDDLPEMQFVKTLS